MFCFFKFLNSLHHFTSAEDEVVKIFTSIIGTNRGSEQLSTHTVTCWSENTPLSFVLFLKKKLFIRELLNLYLSGPWYFHYLMSPDPHTSLVSSARETAIAPFMLLRANSSFQATAWLTQAILLHLEYLSKMSD